MIALLSYGTDLSGLISLTQTHNAFILARNLKKNVSRTACWALFGRPDEKYVIRHQNMRSQGLTGLAGPIATSEIVLHYAVSTLTKRTDFNFSTFSYS